MGTSNTWFQGSVIRNSLLVGIVWFFSEFFVLFKVFFGKLFALFFVALLVFPELRELVRANTLRYRLYLLVQVLEGVCVIDDDLRGPEALAVEGDLLEELYLHVFLNLNVAVPAAFEALSQRVVIVSFVATGDDNDEVEVRRPEDVERVVVDYRVLTDVDVLANPLHEPVFVWNAGVVLLVNFGEQPLVYDHVRQIEQLEVG